MVLINRIRWRMLWFPIKLRIQSSLSRLFFAALMTHEMSDTDKTLKNINECSKMKIPAVPPNLNHENAAFGVDRGRITLLG